MAAVDVHARDEHTEPSRLRRSFLQDLQGQPAFGRIGPNWFAAVMGTGIIANAAVTLPVSPPGIRAFALAVWFLAVLLLVVIAGATVTHWVAHPRQARSWLVDPVMSHFYGAPAMGLMTVGAGALLVAEPVLGNTFAVALSAVLWTAGTLLGLWTAAAVPLRAFTVHDVAADSAFGGWLMPVVPPMVSAATGALLIPHLPAGEPRETMLLACYAMFGLTLLASLVVIAMIWSRLVHHKVGAAAAVPTLWIVLGPLGQSITAAHNLAGPSGASLPAPYGRAFEALAVVYGVPVWGFAMLWLIIAATVTLRTARDNLPFSLTWWSFTFPVGTVVTGTSGLAAATGLHVLVVASVALFVLLLAAWATVLARTAHGVWRGRLLNS